MIDESSDFILGINKKSYIWKLNTTCFLGNFLVVNFNFSQKVEVFMLTKLTSVQFEWVPFIVLSWSTPRFYWNTTPGWLCVNMTERDTHDGAFTRVDVCVFCRAGRVIKHRADSGAAVKGPCSRENGQSVKEGEEEEEEGGN